MPFFVPTYSLSLTSPIQRDTEILSLVPTIIPTAIQPNLGPAHRSTHPSTVVQLSATQNGLDNEALAGSGVDSQRKREKAGSPSTLSNGSAEPYKSKPSFSQTVSQAAQQPLLIISKVESQAMPKVASCNVNLTSITQQGEVEESSHLQTSSRASSPSVQSVDSASNDTNLSNLSLFVAPTDSQLTIKATMSSPVHQTKEVTFKSRTRFRSDSGDLQEALVLLARGKEEAESTILELEQKLDEQELQCMELERELVIAQTEVQQMRESRIQQQQALEKWVIQWNTVLNETRRSDAFTSDSIALDLCLNGMNAWFVIQKCLALSTYR